MKLSVCRYTNSDPLGLHLDSISSGMANWFHNEPVFIIYIDFRTQILNIKAKDVWNLKLLHTQQMDEFEIRTSVLQISHYSM